MGRAGRGKGPGQAVIQTYDPDNYAIKEKKRQDYEEFYNKEIEYRQMLYYPPVWNLLLIHIQSQNQYSNDRVAEELFKCCEAYIKRLDQKLQLVGPADAAVAKVNDIYRKVIYIKTREYDTLVDIKDNIEKYVKDNPAYRNVSVQFDFNPTSGF